MFNEHSVVYVIYFKCRIWFAFGVYPSNIKLESLILVKT